MHGLKIRNFPTKPNRPSNNSHPLPAQLSITYPDQLLLKRERLHTKCQPLKCGKISAMRRLVRLDEIKNPFTLAENLKSLLEEDNDDIHIEFPNIAKRYSQGSVQEIAERIIEDRELQKDGVQEWYLVYKEDIATGIGVIVSNPRCTPKELNNVNSPNLSGFICRPYRGEGLGRFSLESRLEIVKRRFGGMAWTLVQTENEVSNKMILSEPGFTIKDRVLLYNNKQYNLYVYKEN